MTEANIAEWEGANCPMAIDHLPGIRSQYFDTERLKIHALQSGALAAEPVIFIHGNFSASNYFEELMLAMPERYCCWAPDLRGYGLTETKTIDARRGAEDWALDLVAFCEALGIDRAHFLAWSAGAAAVLQLLSICPSLVRSVSLVAPVSPYGFGGSKTHTGEPCYSDFAGSGGGLVSADFVAAIRAQDRSSDSDLSPRNVIQNSFFAKPQLLQREEALLSASLNQRLGSQHYPGDFYPSDHWPHVRPGMYGPLNAISAQYLDLSQALDVANKPRILWLRGGHDSIISDESLSEMGQLGRLGLIPGWPGIDVFPPQAMISQTRHWLEQYRERGGRFREVLFPELGHSPFIEDPEMFMQSFTGFLEE